MHSSLEGFETLSAWQRSNTPLRLFSFGSVLYIPEGAEVTIAPIGATDRVVVEVVGAVPGIEPVKPSFDMTGAQFSRFAPDDAPVEVPLLPDDMRRYKLLLWVKMTDKTTLLFAEQ